MDQEMHQDHKISVANKSGIILEMFFQVDIVYLFPFILFFFSEITNNSN